MPFGLVWFVSYWTPYELPRRGFDRRLTAQPDIHFHRSLDICIVIKCRPPHDVFTLNDWSTIAHRYEFDKTQKISAKVKFTLDVEDQKRDDKL